MVITAEQRRHKRFEVTAFPAKLFLVYNELETELCELVNLSYGGVCFRTRRLFLPGELRNCAVCLPWPLTGVVFVTIRIRWVEPENLDYDVVGAEFVESSSGWLGPEDAKAA